MKKSQKYAIGYSIRAKEGVSMLSKDTLEAAKILDINLAPKNMTEGRYIEQNFIIENLKKAQETLERRRQNPSYRIASYPDNKILLQFLKKYKKYIPK